MRHHASKLGLALCLAIIPIAPAHGQELEATPETSTPATIADLYVQVPNGVNVYSVASTGKPTLIKGSPFSTSGQMEGVNGKYLLSVGTDDLHSYAIATSGAVGKQAYAVNTQNYSGSECGTTSYNGAANGAFLDHTGSRFYVQLYGALVYYNNNGGSSGYVPNCAAWQSYQVESNGDLTFVDGLEYFVDACQLETCGGSALYPDARPSTVPTVTSNDGFGYGVFGLSGVSGPTELSLSYGATGEFSRLILASNGLMAINNSFRETDPLAQPGECCGWEVAQVKADPANHLAALLYSESSPPGCPCGPFQLASYTINNSSGDISSTNTWENMPIPKLTSISDMSMSPSGKLLALFGYPGLELFHFNGAAPITPFGSELLPTTNIDQLGWDNNNHLYALSYSSKKLYIYTVTPTSISAVSGSPFAVPNAYGIKGMIVVPK